MLHSAVLNVMIKAAHRAGRSLKRDLGEVEQLQVSVKGPANFVTVDCGRDGAFARRLLEQLLERRIFLRMPGVAPLDRCIRVSAGTDADLDALAEALPEALAAARQDAS